LSFWVADFRNFLASPEGWSNAVLEDVGLGKLAGWDIFTRCFILRREEGDKMESKSLLRPGDGGGGFNMWRFLKELCDLAIANTSEYITNYK
jgi:hypothetical protein